RTSLSLATSARSSLNETAMSFSLVSAGIGSTLRRDFLATTLKNPRFSPLRGVYSAQKISTIRVLSSPMFATAGRGGKSRPDAGGPGLLQLINTYFI